MTLVERARDHAERMPVAFAPHGGGPWPFVDMGLPKSEVDELATYPASCRLRLTSQCQYLRLLSGVGSALRSSVGMS